MKTGMLDKLMKYLELRRSNRLKYHNLVIYPALEMTKNILKID